MVSGPFESLSVNSKTPPGAWSTNTGGIDLFDCHEIRKAEEKKVEEVFEDPSLGKKAIRSRKRHALLK